MPSVKKKCRNFKIKEIMGVNYNYDILKKINIKKKVKKLLNTIKTKNLKKFKYKIVKTNIPIMAKYHILSILPNRILYSMDK
jgi:hypothetical protein